MVMMRRLFIGCSLLLILLVAVGCGAETNTIQRVTSIPSVAEQPLSTPVAIVASSTVAPAVQATLPPSPSSIDDVSDATSTPLSNNLAEGDAREIALATDAALRPTPRNPLTFDQSPVPITFDEFYDGYNIRTGLMLSDMLLSLDGDSVQIDGYMAPPLKPELDYFVLTRIRLSFCPFCSTAADWPDDIALVYMQSGTTTATLLPIRITGRIEIGQSVDQETGMVSLVRIYADQLETLG